MAPRAVADGLISLGQATQTCPAHLCLVALYVDPLIDYHFYRKNDVGYWSHKPGSLEATTKDDSHNEIGWNLLAAGSGNYIFCEFMCVPCDIEISGTPSRRLHEQVETRFFDIQILARSGVNNPGWDLEDGGEIDTIQGALVRDDLIQWIFNLREGGFRTADVSSFLEWSCTVPGRI